MLLAAIFWYIKTMNDVYETEVCIPVVLKNVPSNVVITTDVGDSVRVVIRDEGFELLSYMNSDEMEPVYVDFKQYATEDYHSVISVNSLTYQILPRFRNTNVISVKPDKLEFYYNYGRHKKVPVMLAGKVSPAEMYYLSQVRFSPDSVVVFAAKNILDNVESVSIKPVNITDFKDTVTLQTEVAQHKGVKVSPSKVRLTLYPDIYTEETVDVPITCVNLPAGKKLRTFPSKAQVHFVIGMRQYKDMPLKGFAVTADYNEITANPKDKTCHLTLRTVPDNVIQPRLLDDEVDFLIEE